MQVIISCRKLRFCFFFLFQNFEKHFQESYKLKFLESNCKLGNITMR